MFRKIAITKFDLANLHEFLKTGSWSASVNMTSQTFQLLIIQIKSFFEIILSPYTK